MDGLYRKKAAVLQLWRSVARPMLPDDAVPQLAPTFRFQWEKAQDCYVILYPEGMVKLSGSAGHIMKMCDGNRSITGIVHQLEEQFGRNETIRHDTEKFLAEAMKNGWIRIKNPS